MSHLADLFITPLNQLVRLNLASERGFEAAAEHVKNRGLKIYLKSYASQRSNFAQQLCDEVERWGGKVKVAPNPLAALHRGWIDVKAGLTIGRDNEAQVVLSECLRGEQIALETYAQARQHIFPVAVDELLEQHARQIQSAYKQLCEMAACDGKSLLVQLFEHAEVAQVASAQLARVGIRESQIEMTPVAQLAAYDCHCHRQRLLESGSAAAAIGGLAGFTLGLMVALPLWLAGYTESANFGLLTPVFLCALAGVLGGALFGMLIGQGIGEDDAHFYETSMGNGGLVVTVQVANTQTTAARQILQMQRQQDSE